MPEPTNRSIYNPDLVSLHRDLNDYIYEVYKSGSANLNEYSSFDQARLQSYFAAVIRKLDWIEAQPHLDLPQTSPKLWPLWADPVTEQAENEDVNVIIRLLLTAREELVNSESARRSSGIVSHDSSRFRAIIAKSKEYIDSYVANTSPLDKPETSPSVPMTGPGRSGV